MRGPVAGTCEVYVPDAVVVRNSLHCCSGLDTTQYLVQLTYQYHLFDKTFDTHTLWVRQGLNATHRLVGSGSLRVRIGMALVIVASSTGCANRFLEQAVSYSSTTLTQKPANPLPRPCAARAALCGRYSCSNDLSSSPQRQNDIASIAVSWSPVVHTIILYAR